MPFGVFAPLPTAVPPSATFCNSFCAKMMLFLAFVIDIYVTPEVLILKIMELHLANVFFQFF